ncbi:hypothetical protein J5277_13100 [Rhizobium sp. 16-449-1b]|uniref:hypothetical protein n=1 Tax=Rhizobium sp. 16-449-1b TaxID=2819989 RepID=UPI001ADB3C03|nr:hypothetical protein [Rhizobium sp. 16-449-1b]MBO9195041.1 hypothetical protein [Rhizobium sp. 16-449-1b]
MERYIVVEGKLDAELIDQFIPDGMVETVGIAIAGGKSAALPLANSIALAQRVPVALVVDADTEEDDRIREQELDFQDFVGNLPLDVPPVLIMGVPTIQHSLGDPDFVRKVRAFINDGDYALANPFAFRR